MNLHIDGNGIHLEITEGDGQSINRLLELSGGNHWLNPAMAYPVGSRSRPSGGFAAAVQRAIKEVAREARTESV